MNMDLRKFIFVAFVLSGMTALISAPIAYAGGVGEPTFSGQEFTIYDDDGFTEISSFILTDGGGTLEWPGGLIVIGRSD